MPLTAHVVREALAPFGVEVDDRLATQVSRYIDILLFWNQKVNLTSITSPGEILQRHFGESMFGASLIERRSGALVDVGSGAGFPGLALKLVCPGLSIRLVEPVMKKAVFLSEVVRVLALSDVEVVRSRLEDLKGIPKAAIVTSRAVGDVSTLLAWAISNLAAGGEVMLWLGADDASKTEAAEGWSWRSRARVPTSKNRVILCGSPVVPRETIPSML